MRANGKGSPDRGMGERTNPSSGAPCGRPQQPLGQDTLPSNEKYAVAVRCGTFKPPIDKFRVSW